MRRQKNNVGMVFGSVLLFSVFLSGCLSMQVDITPEPDSAPVDEIVDTPVSTQEPNQSAPTPTISLDAEGIEGEVIVVDVIDQTGGMLLEQELEIVLAGYDQFELVYQDAKPLTAESRSVFDNIPFEAGRVFFASISHGGAIYRSDMFEAGDETTSMQMTVQIFNTTTSDEKILIDRIHVLVSFPFPDKVQVVEIFIVSNLGDSTFVADSPGQASLSFPLPVGAESILFDDGALGERYVKTEDGFGDTASIPPGASVYQTLVYYTLPIQGNELEFSQTMNYPVQAAVIMTPAGEAVIEGSTVQDMGIQAIPDGSYQVYSVSAIPRDETIQFRVSVEEAEAAAPAAAQAPAPAPMVLSQWIILGAGGFGLLLLVTGIWLYFRQRKSIAEEFEPDGRSSQGEEILDSIIALEDLYNEGEITENAFLKKRQEFKDQLDSLADG